MNITKFSIQRPVGISMIVMLFVVLGIFSFYRIGVELLPAVNTPYVTVSVRYPGASAEQVEQDVTKPLEDALSSVANVKKISSFTRQESTTLVLEFQFWANADYASIEATKFVNAARSKLPDDVDEPTVIKRDINASSIMEISIITDRPLGELNSLVENVLAERIQRAAGVSDVEITGGRRREIAVELDKDKLFANNISLSQVISQIRSENKLLPAGSVYTDKTEANVRLLAQYTSLDDLNQIMIPTGQGGSITLNSLGTIEARDSKVNRYARTNGQAVVSMTIYKNSDANIVKTAEEVRIQIDALKKDYPDLQFVVITDSSEYVQQSLDNTLMALIEGLITTGLALYLFLRGWRSTVAVIIAIPTSLIATFFVMYMMGFTFNMMSLMGMALCIGILVDDSIVVLENIHRHLMMGKDAATAAEDGRNEIGMAAISITLCDVVVFLPIAFMSGMAGQFFRQFGLTIVVAALFSLFISFTLTPMIASKLYKNGFYEPTGKIWDFMEKWESRAIAGYRNVLLWSLTNAKKVLLGVLGLFVLSIALIPMGFIGSEFSPKTDESAFQVNIQMPVGENIEQTNQVIVQVEEYMAQIPEVKNYLSSVGAPAGNNGRVSVQLVAKNDRSRDVWEVTDQVRKELKKMLPQAIVQVTETQSMTGGAGGGGGARGPIQVELRSNNNAELVDAYYKAQEEMKQIPGIKDVGSSYTEGMPEIRLKVDREKLKFYSTSIGQVNNVFNASISGGLAGTFANDPLNNGKDTDINVRLKGSGSYQVSDIRSIPVQTSKGTLVRLGDIAEIEDATGPVMIRRVDKQRAISIGASSDQPLAEALEAIRSRLTPQVLGENVSIQFVGQANDMNETFSEMMQALVLSLLLVYMLLAVLYESTTTPLIRMFSLPLGLMGSLFFLAMTNNSINLYSLIGILVMDGLVAKNGTLLLDYTLTLMREGKEAKEAIVEAGCTRLKPIFMTTLTMIVAMLPTALSVTTGSENRVGMAWVLIGGLLTSTIFTLIVTPIVFLYFEKKPITNFIKKVISKVSNK